MYSVQEQHVCLFSFLVEVMLASFTLQHFQYILQLIYQIVFLCTYSFCSLKYPPTLVSASILVLLNPLVSISFTFLAILS